MDLERLCQETRRWGRNPCTETYIILGILTVIIERFLQDDLWTCYKSAEQNESGMRNGADEGRHGNDLGIRKWFLDAECGYKPK